MSNQRGGWTTEQSSAAERIEEARRLTETIGKSLNDVLVLVKQGKLDGVERLPSDVKRLTDAIADVRKKEAEFNELFGAGTGDGDIDFDALRVDIGCRLGRIRRCCKS